MRSSIKRIVVFILVVSLVLLLPLSSIALETDNEADLNNKVEENFPSDPAEVTAGDKFVSDQITISDNDPVSDGGPVSDGDPVIEVEPASDGDPVIEVELPSDSDPVSDGEPVEKQIADVNFEMKLDVRHDEILSGEQNFVNLRFKTTGAQTVFENVDIQISSSENSLIVYDENNLDTILGDWFDSYNIDGDGNLHIVAEELPSGRYFDLPIIFRTRNGLTPIDTKITFEASFKSDGLTYEVNKTNPVSVISSSPLKINKKLLGTSIEDIESKMMRYGTDTYWLTKAAIDGASTGQQFIKEGTKIVITETYDEHLVYKEMAPGFMEPTDVNEEERTITWEYDAPSYVEQENNLDTGALWNENLVVIYTTIEEPETDGVAAEVVKELDVRVEMSFTNISDEELEDSDTVTFDLYPNETYIPNLDGYWNVFGTWGPIDGEGNHGYASVDDMNIGLMVFQKDTLTYAHRLSSMFNGRYLSLIHI